MSLSKHPNVLRVRGCWVKGAKLHIATRRMSSGSMLDIMRFAHPVLQERELGIVVDPDQAVEAEPESAAAAPAVERVKA